MKLEPNDFVEHPYDFAVKVFLEIVGCMDELVVLYTDGLRPLLELKKAVLCGNFHLL